MLVELVKVHLHDKDIFIVELLLNTLTKFILKHDVGLGDLDHLPRDLAVHIYELLVLIQKVQRHQVLYISKVVLDLSAVLLFFFLFFIHNFVGFIVANIVTMTFFLDQFDSLAIRGFRLNLFLFTLCLLNHVLDMSS